MKQIEIEDAAKIASQLRKKFGNHIKISAVFDELFLISYNMYRDKSLNEQIKQILKE
jgi:hypothetical protein